MRLGAPVFLGEKVSLGAPAFVEKTVSLGAPDHSKTVRQGAPYGGVSPQHRI
jgi:hypothetical protein